MRVWFAGLWFSQFVVCWLWFGLWFGGLWTPGGVYGFAVYSMI
jgi:hypothetical protein